MSKVTVELDFLWEKRLLDLYLGFKEEYDFEGMELIVSVLKIQGLTVEGIEE